MSLLWIAAILHKTLLTAKLLRSKHFQKFCCEQCLQSFKEMGLVTPYLIKLFSWDDSFFSISLRKIT